MEYLHKLLEQFSDTPRNIVIKADLLRRGIKLTPDLQKAGETANTSGLSSKLETILRTGGPPPSGTLLTEFGKHNRFRRNSLEEAPWPA